MNKSQALIQVNLAVQDIDTHIWSSVVNWLHILWWEHAHSSTAPPPPALGIRTVQQVNDITAQETEMSRMMRCEVKEGMGMTWPLKHTHTHIRDMMRLWLVKQQSSKTNVKKLMSNFFFFFLRNTHDWETKLQLQKLREIHCNCNWKKV